MSEKIYAILLAGGAGTRMGAPVNKILLPVAGIPCIARSALALSPFADHLVLVGRPEEEVSLREALSGAGAAVPISFAPGGIARQDSVYSGLRMIAAMERKSGYLPDSDSDTANSNSCHPAEISDLNETAQVSDAIILIHDGARCLVSPEVIESCIDSVRSRGSGVAAVPVTDTLRPADETGLFGDTVPREGLFAMQTPQAFRLRPLLSAFKKAYLDGFLGTDDASVMAHAGYPVHLSEGSRLNLKLTTKEDLQMAESILSSASLPPFRVGQGYDVHQLCEGRKLILCGVEVPHPLGLLGHSDADVALHALMDALLGAAGMGDIGRHFPDTDEQYKGIDSMKLLADVMEKLHHEGFHPVNVDVTIVAQKPRLAPYIPRMTENLANALGIPLSCVNVKATTTERLGFEGRMEGISAQAVCLLHKNE